MGIDYYHLPERGIASLLRKLLDGPRPETYSRLFDHYEKSILPHAAESIARIIEIAK